MTHIVTVANPLPDALYHYMIELRETLARINVSVDYDDTIPSIEGVGLSGKIAYLLARSKRINNNECYLSTWSSVGLLEPWLFHGHNSDFGVINHDPVPLRRQSGFGVGSRLLASIFRSKHVQIIDHSPDAHAVLTNLYPHAEIISMMHPILSHQNVKKTTEGVVLVAGQYKPSRDLDLLSKLGYLLKKNGLRPRIVGRGWPSDLEAWEVVSRFASEDELTEELTQASVLCVPYKHFFQSGVMIRALEQGTLSVSPQNSFVTQLLGSSPFIVQTPEIIECWVTAIEQAVDAPQEMAEALFLNYREKCDISWLAGLELMMSRDA